MEISKSRGYLYVAVGDKYIREAEASAASLLRINSDANIHLITNCKYDGNIFTQHTVTNFPILENEQKTGYLTKIIGMELSPFEKTIFIDTDTYFCDHCDELFNVLEYFDFLICHDYMEVTYALVNNASLEGYRSYNSGVIAFKKSLVSQSFIEDWKNRFTSKDYIGDQPAFMESMLYSNAKIYSLQTNYNFRFNQFLTVPNGKVKILHGRHKNMAEIGRIVNSRMDHRVWDPIAWTCRGWFDLKTRRYRIKSAIKKLINSTRP